MQGLTGGQGKFHGLRNRDYGTKVVAGVTPGKGGQDVEGIPVFDTVAEAVEATGATASFVAVPPKAAPAAILEAAAAGIGFVVCITEGIPAQDEARVYNTLVRDFPATRLLGPNCPGIISPGKCNIGITPSDIAELPTPDGPNVGIVSRSGTLTYQALYELKQNGIGVSTCVGIGGDPVPGTSFVDCLAEFQADPETHAMIMFGEIGGSAEEEAAEFITANVTKPMSAYIAGVTAPPGRKMGHAGAIVSGGKGTAQGKMDALAAAGVSVGLNPTEAGELMAGLLQPLTAGAEVGAAVGGTAAGGGGGGTRQAGAVAGATQPSSERSKAPRSLSTSVRSRRSPPDSVNFMTGADEGHDRRQRAEPRCRRAGDVDLVGMSSPSPGTAAGSGSGTCPAPVAASRMRGHGAAARLDAPLASSRASDAAADDEDPRDRAGEEEVERVAAAGTEALDGDADPLQERRRSGIRARRPRAASRTS